MFEDILNGISTGLFDAFGAGHRIYGDHTVETGLELPCFVIKLISSDRSKFAATRFMRTYPFDIIHIASDDGGISGQIEIGEALMRALDSITVRSHPIFGRDMHYEVIDGELHFFVSFAVTGGYVEDDTNEMETLTVDNIGAEQ